MAKETIQVTLGGKKISVQKGFASRVRHLKDSNKKPSDYEEVFRDLMRYSVIRVDEIHSVEDFGNVLKRYDSRGTISETLIDELHQTSEFKEMIADKIRLNDVTLKGGQMRKGLFLEESHSWLYVDSSGRMRARSYDTGRFASVPDFYGMAPIADIKKLF